ncbi:uncharacterized protein BDW47DRAFT_12086 [Aspergillus candidus]|uniref:Uncharacterized protein n=1 Tax=Aspergillus candidus TaxID=41067 RepID=A0A2I2FGH4_ASPCN|nr:hypothetical protein BDW47DRAFT_12086 [Aspergillus candidus]PLB39728.1 hypothetical protein BDW47DRAFT_12086 [Aspergillus candidus]
MDAPHCVSATQRREDQLGNAPWAWAHSSFKFLLELFFFSSFCSFLVWRLLLPRLSLERMPAEHGDALSLCCPPKGVWTLR